MEQEQQAVNNRKMVANNKETLLTKKIILIFAAVVLFGIVSGYIIFVLNKSTSSSRPGLLGTSQVSGEKIFGSKNEKIFKDTAEGVLKAGGIDGEGSSHLERPGGASQNVYLTSSVVDLSLFIEKRVKVWGVTYKAKKAGWLMDVGRLQVLE